MSMMFHEKGPSFAELIRQALTSTERGYDLLAPKFDYTPFRTPDPVLQAAANVTGGPSSIATALDVCCGTGAAMAHFRPLCRERIVGIDFSRGMLAEAERRLATAPGRARIELVRGDALELPFREEFDVVTCFGALGHILPADEPRFVSGIRRALRPGGRFVFATAEVPSLLSPTRWVAHAFNGVMHVRNALAKPPFVMYYLTFLWPDVRSLLENHGFHVTAHHETCGPPYTRAIIVTAEKRPS
jgi:ubiquinone/menaquinone biosynthesis C-methylase UbiE